MTLEADPAFERAFRGRLAALVAERGGGWRLLGFNGDLCVYDGELSALLAARFPVPAEQGRFLLGSLARAALADPLPYAGKVLNQLAHGFLTAFGRFAVYGRTGTEGYEAAAQTYRLSPAFLAGVSLVTEHGPLGTKARLDTTLAGRATQALLAVIFHATTALLVGLAVASVLIPLLRWRHWPETTRATFLAFVALPLGALLAHHLLIALVHTFDVWRYGFNVFFVNLLFMGAAALFWLDQWRRAADTRPAPLG